MSRRLARTPSRHARWQLVVVHWTDCGRMVRTAIIAWMRIKFAWLVEEASRSPRVGHLLTRKGPGAARVPPQKTGLLEYGPNDQHRDREHSTLPPHLSLDPRQGHTQVEVPARNDHADRTLNPQRLEPLRSSHRKRDGSRRLYNDL